MSLPHFPPEGSGPEPGRALILPAPIILPAHCGTAVAAGLQGELVAALAAQAAPVIDAGAVESLGQAVLQLLLAARADRLDLRFEPVSAAFAERALRCGLGSALGIQGLAA